MPKRRSIGSAKERPRLLDRVKPYQRIMSSAACARSAAVRWGEALGDLATHLSELEPLRGVAKALLVFLKPKSLALLDLPAPSIPIRVALICFLSSKN